MGLRNYMQQEGWRRFGVQLLALLQLAAVGLVPTADALLEQAATDDPTHVEPLGTDCGDVPHDHTYCQLCRVLSFKSLAAPGGDAVAPAAPEHVAVANGHIPSSTSNPHLFGGLGSRAPPLA